MSGTSLNDLRLGVRRLVRTPAATLTVLAALSVGIGLPALMFSLVSSAVFPTLPFEPGDRIVRVKRVELEPITAEALEYWRARQRSFEGLYAWVERPVNLTVGGESGEPVYGAGLDVAATEALAVRPLLGRAFTEADAVPGAPAVVLLGHEVWRTRLDGDPGVIGRTVRVDGQTVEVVGVMPEGFAFPFIHSLWTPLRVDALRPERDPQGLSVFGILREGVSSKTALAELSELDRQRPRAAGEPEPVTLEVRAFTDIVNPAGQSQLIAGLMLAVGVLVLLVACANATNVLLAQAAGRARDVAIRTALGASRLRIALQYWSELALLAFAGAAGGVLLASVGLRLIRNAIPPGMPFWMDLRIDPSTLAFVAAAAVLAAIAAGLAPALHSAGASGQDLLKDSSRGASSRRLGRVMRRLVGLEMAVSFVLLIAAGLFVRSAVNLETYDFAFAPEEVYRAHLRLPEGRYDGAADRMALASRLETELSAIPGASGAALATALPGVGADLRAVALEGVHDPAGPELPEVWDVAATPAFFPLFDAPALEGRLFDARDRAGSLATAIVNQSFQRRHMPDGAVGRRIALPDGRGETKWLTIVGVVPDLFAAGLDNDPQDAVYRPLAQAAPPGFQLAVRSEGSAMALAAPVRAAVSRVDSDAALFFITTLQKSIEGANAQFRWMGALFLVAGGLSLFLAAIGLFGVMGFWVTQRTREIGVRMALGGRRGAIVRLVVRQAALPILLGVAAGLLLAAPVAWLARDILLDVPPFDPIVFGTVAGVLVGAGALGCLLPALRATRVDPQRALAGD